MERWDAKYVLTLHFAFQSDSLKGNRWIVDKRITLFNNYLIAALLGMVFDNQPYQQIVLNYKLKFQSSLSNIFIYTF